MKSKIILISLFALSINWLGAQETGTGMDFPSITDSSAYQSNTLKQSDKKLHVGANLEMSYVFSKNYSGPMTYFSPYLSYPLTNRLSLYAGITAGYGAIYSPYLKNETGSGNLMPMTQLFLFAASSYKVNQNLTVTGSAYKQINTIPNLNKQRVSANYSNSGVTVGFNYKVAPGFSFGAQIGFDSRETYPWGMRSNSIGNNFYSPYGW